MKQQTTQNVYYYEEKEHATKRLIVLMISSIFSFIIYEQTEGIMREKMLYATFALCGLVFASMSHFFLLAHKPKTMIAYRKNFIIFLDLMTITFFIVEFGRDAVFFFPLYILTVLRSGLSFGIAYFYSSIVFAVVSWATILKYSDYWRENSDVMAAFAVTTLLLPFFYIRFITRVHDKNSELSTALTTTEYDANYDVLTGLANRKLYKEEIHKTLKQRNFFALLFIDLNKFKAINDTHGHHIGDEVLMEVAKRLKNTIDEDDFISRLGGDEFVIITKRKKVFMEKFIDKLESETIGEHTINDVTIMIELSIGISFYPNDSKEETMLNKYADEAMYIAKKKDGTYHQFYNDIRHTDKLSI